MLNSLITHTTPTGNIPEAPELGTPRYKGWFPTVSVIEGFRCTFLSGTATHILTCMPLLYLCSDTCDPNMPRENCDLYAFRHRIDLTSSTTMFSVNIYLLPTPSPSHKSSFPPLPALSQILLPTPSHPLTNPPSHSSRPLILTNPPFHPLSPSHKSSFPLLPPSPLTNPPFHPLPPLTLSQTSFPPPPALSPSHKSSFSPPLTLSPSPSCSPSSMYHLFHFLPLGFQDAIQAVNTTQNVDSPENGLEALAQVVSCESVIGWRSRTADGMERGQTRVVLFLTDDQFHYSGEGRVCF